MKNSFEDHGFAISSALAMRDWYRSRVEAACSDREPARELRFAVCCSAGSGAHAWDEDPAGSRKTTSSTARSPITSLTAGFCGVELREPGLETPGICAFRFERSDWGWSGIWLRFDSILKERKVDSAEVDEIFDWQFWDGEIQEIGRDKSFDRDRGKKETELLGLPQRYGNTECGKEDCGSCKSWLTIIIAHPLFLVSAYSKDG